MMQSTTLQTTRTIEDLAGAAKAASHELSARSTDQKDAVLLALADEIEASHEVILAANETDMSAARTAGLAEARLRRLQLTAEALTQVAEGLRQIVTLPDPVGRVVAERTVASGLRVKQVGCPIGVIAIIYEARPAVTIDAFALCFKAGNACILKGGREAGESNRVFTSIARGVLERHGFPAACLTALITSDREQLRRLLTLDQYVDLVIPRGGASLIRFVHENSRIPTVQHFHGVCHTYVDDAADLERALRICVTAKTSAPSACNALECVLVHEAVAAAFVPALVDAFMAEGVEVRGDPAVRALAASVVAASDEDWGREFLDLVVAVRIVPDVAAAIDHIRTYGSNHTESVITTDASTAARFTREVQSSCVLVNASTRFNDGFQLGLGAEIGISTSRVHAYGPMGLEELTVRRYIVATSSRRTSRSWRRWRSSS